MNHDESNKRYAIKDFLPLIAVFAIVISFTGLRQFANGFDMRAAMQDFMAALFLLFGAFKLLNLKGFADAYATYDVIAKKSKTYAYVYPFIEIGLGLCYLFRLFPKVTNFITLIVMFVSAIGVAIELSKKNRIDCACLGVVFKLPMTYVTLFEDLLMAAMALIMLFW